jgi:hypothetical protein
MFVEDIFMNLVEKTMIAYVQPTLANYLLAICTFVFGCPKEHMMFLMSLLILSQVIEKQIMSPLGC